MAVTPQVQVSAEPEFEVFREGDPLYARMLGDIEAAQQRVWLESYIFTEDRVGEAFIAALCACARRGVDVRMRLDSVGSWGGLSYATVGCLWQAGVHFTWCHPFDWLRPWRFHRRNHRKLLVVDSVAAYVGGFNITEHNSLRHYGEQRWRDTHVRVTGHLVTEAGEAWSAFERGHLGWQPARTGDAHFLASHGRPCRYRLRCSFQHQFATARERIWVTTPYLVPDSGVRRHLSKAARRGVDVRIIVPVTADPRPLGWATHSFYANLLTAGVRVFEYQPRMLHAKTIIVDWHWGTVGTANFDYRSLFINYELNLVANSRELNRDLAADFTHDLCESIEIHRPTWLVRSWRGRAGEWLARRVRRWL